MPNARTRIQTLSNASHTSGQPARYRRFRTKREVAFRDVPWSVPGESPLIIDLALLSYRELREQHRALGNPLFYFWLHWVRPALVGIAWLLIGLHLWRHFVPQAPEHRVLAMVVLGAIMVTSLFMLMRHRIHRQPDDEHGHSHHESPAYDGHAASPMRAGKAWTPRFATLAEIAKYAALHRHDLFVWQQSRQLRVQHNDEGRLIHAIDMPLPPLAAPHPTGLANFSGAHAAPPVTAASEPWHLTPVYPSQGRP